MKTIVLLALFVVRAARASDSSFDCAVEQTVRLGHGAAAVLAQCGPPTKRLRFVEQRLVPPSTDELARQTACEDQMRKLWTDGGQAGSPPDTSACVAAPVMRPVRVEVWTYDLGENMFVRTLRFEDGTLICIDTGFYGTGG